MTNTQSTFKPTTPTTDRGGIQQAIRALRADGWELRSVNDGGENVRVRTETEAVENITAVDEAWLHVKRGDERGYVFFVLGNAPDEVVCDYTTNLTALDALIDAWIELS